jgi:hypothetical protein
MSILTPHSPKTRLLAVGGTYVFEGASPCRLTVAQPAEAVKDLHWQDSVALEAIKEGTAQISCGDEITVLKIIVPARLEIRLVDGNSPRVETVFLAEAILFGPQKEELETGKLTTFHWTSSDGVEAVSERSAGEFGLSDNQNGMQKFRALQSGPAWIAADFGGLKATLAFGK